MTAPAEATVPSLAAPKQRGKAAPAIIAALLVAVAVWAANHMLVAGPIGDALTADKRNSTYSLSAHFEYYVLPSGLVLDLREVESASTVDLFRGLFQAAEAMNEADRHFDHILLARSGVEVYRMKGDDFTSLGKAFAAGENPLYLLRTLPQQLLTPAGTSAFDTWTGGVLGVMGKQMEDLNKAGRTWANGTSR